MDEVIGVEKIGPWEVEDIFEESLLYRQLHVSQRIGKKPRRFPNEAHFGLRDDETYLSFNWNKHIDLEKNYKLMGISKSKSGNFLNVKEFSIFQYPVTLLKGISKVKDILHIPVYNEIEPSPVGKPNNRAHAGVCCHDNDLQFRADLSEYCNEHHAEAFCNVDPSILIEEIEALKERANNTPYHKDWVF